MPPNALVDFVLVETLEYVATTEHIELLYDTLRWKNSLPSLKKLNLRLATDFWSKTADIPRIREAFLALLKICDKRIIHLSDFAYFLGA